MATNTKLIPLKTLREARPDWPFGEWWTRELMRRGELGCVQLGRRRFLTDDIINAFIESHQVPALDPLERRTLEVQGIAAAATAGETHEG